MVRGRSPVPERGRGRSLSPKQQRQDKSVPAPPVAVKIKGPPNLMDHGYGNLPLALIPEHEDDDDFLKAVKRCIPSEFVLIASQDDISKAQEDHYAMEHFQLKPPEGRTRWSNSELAGSVATCALLQFMYENPQAMVAPSPKDTDNNSNNTMMPTTTPKPYSTLEILQEIQTRIKICTGQDANPTSYIIVIETDWTTSIRRGNLCTLLYCTTQSYPRHTSSLINWYRIGWRQCLKRYLE